MFINIFSAEYFQFRIWTHITILLRPLNNMASALQFLLTYSNIVTAFGQYVHFGICMYVPAIALCPDFRRQIFWPNTRSNKSKSREIIGWWRSVLTSSSMNYSFPYKWYALNGIILFLPEHVKWKILLFEINAKCTTLSKLRTWNFSKITTYIEILEANEFFMHFDSVE